MCIANGVFIGGFEQGSGMGDTQRRSGTQKEDERRVACKETVSVWDHWWQSIPRWREQTCGEVVRGGKAQGWGPRRGSSKGVEAVALPLLLKMKEDTQWQPESLECHCLHLLSTLTSVPMLVAWSARGVLTKGALGRNPLSLLDLLIQTSPPISTDWRALG